MQHSSISPCMQVVEQATMQGKCSQSMLLHLQGTMQSGADALSSASLWLVQQAALPLLPAVAMGPPPFARPGADTATSKMCLSVIPLAFLDTAILVFACSHCGGH